MLQNILQIDVSTVEKILLCTFTAALALMQHDGMGLT
jgi:hypothetical protein